MSLTNYFENELQDLIFNNTTIPYLGDATGLVGSTADGSLFIALHTADPAESPANQSANEASYPGYARQEVIRQATGSPNGGWTVSGATASNTAEIQFGAHSGGSPATQNITHFSVGYGDGGSPNADLVFYTGALSGTLAVSSGVNPTFAAGQLQISVD